MSARIVVAALVLLLNGTAFVAAQDDVPPASPARLFESGSYDQAVARVQGREGGEVAPEDVFWAGQSLVRLDRRGEAADTFGRLGGSDEDPWRAVGQSAAALARGDQAGAVAAGVRATELAPDMFHAHYQLGLARVDGQQWAQAASAFERASQIDGNSAYAHYYAGMAYNRTKQLPPMLSHLNRFLELAPNAPERDVVQQLLKALKGMR